MQNVSGRLAQNIRVFEGSTEREEGDIEGERNDDQKQGSAAIFVHGAVLLYLRIGAVNYTGSKVSTWGNRSRLVELDLHGEVRAQHVQHELNAAFNARFVDGLAADLQ